jgi:hypothetical protein
VFPTPSSEVGATVYVNKVLDLVVADGVTLTANTAGNHYFSIGAQVTLVGTAYVIFDLDGTYTITGIPTANSFTCSTVLAGISYNGTASSPGIECGDIISYFSTTNSNLWVNNVTNKTWQITGGSNVGTSWTFTTSAPSNFPVGSQVQLNLPGSGYLNYTSTVTASTDTTFTCTVNGRFVMLSYNDQARQAYSTDNGLTWNYANISISNYSERIAYGNGFFITNLGIYSNDNGFTWNYGSIPQLDYFPIAYGNGVFVVVGASGTIIYSSDNGQTWTLSASYIAGYPWQGVAFGNGVFVVVGSFYPPNIQAYSTDNGVTWNLVTSSIGGRSVAYGNGVFVMVAENVQAYSTDNGLSWNSVASPLLVSMYCVAYGNGVFVAGGFESQSYSTDNGLTWNLVTNTLPGEWTGVTFGNGVFVMVSDYPSSQAYSTDGITWNFATKILGTQAWNDVAYGEFTYTSSPSDSVSLVVPPLQLTNRVFSSSVYQTISFQNAADAAFWGFDSREGLTYALPATPPWTLTQSGWISGFLPPSTSTYDDSVAHKLCKAVRVLVGKQTIKEYSGEYIELQNDLLVPYENKAILKLMNGTLDQTQATVAREYYVNLPLGTKEVPLCALTHQHMSVEVDFDSYQNVSQNLNQGTGSFVDAKSYTTYDASTGLLGGQPVNVQTTFSYQQYIFIVTYGGQFIIFDTTKNVDDPTSYIVLSAFSGSSLFSQFCVLSGNLYIGLTNGQLARMIITELIQGNISSFVVNNYGPTIGSLTGTIVADFRYVYYTVSNTVTSNVFMTRYDTTGVFTNPGSYTTVDFTKTFNSSVTGVYQTLLTGTELIMLPQGTPGSFYTYQLNANVQSQWYVIDYSLYAQQITEGVLIGSDVYFVRDNLGILKYSNSNFTKNIYIGSLFSAAGHNLSQLYSVDNGQSWYLINNALAGDWYSVAFGNGVFVMVGDGVQAYSTDSGLSWTSVASISGIWSSVAYGNGVFVMVGDDVQAYSTDNGLTWNSVTSPLGGGWRSISYGNGVFVMVSYYNNAYSTDNGRSWTLVANPTTSPWKSVTFGNGIFVMVASNNQAYSVDNGVTWTLVDVPLAGPWQCIAYGNGIFVMAASTGIYAYSSDGLSWTLSTNPSNPYGSWERIAYGNGYFVTLVSDTQEQPNQAWSIDGETWTQSTNVFNDSLYGAAANVPLVSGDGLRNLIAVGNYIYCSTNNVAIQIDTSKDFDYSTAAGYILTAPLPVNQYVLANGPRYVYMFAQGDNTATNIVEFDPYGPDTTFKASILVDYESLPPGVPKPDKALLGLVQTQKVTDMNYMNIKGPVKELWVTGASDTANVFQYSNLAARSTLELTGEQIITNDVGTRTFLNTIEPFETHTSMPIRNVSVIPFEFDPESEIPNGTINFSRIRDQILSANAATVWARNYNLLSIQGGIGGLIFNS